ncbi:MAG: hypothetical protein Q8N17_26085 [Burkholderiaceae bacterium]|nr:hypothetical protein [Burkholderiaceae bacterium]
MNIADLRRRYAGFSDDEIVEALRATKYQDFSPQEIKDVLGIKPPKRSLFAIANDSVIEAGNAVAGTAGAVANFVQPGNAFSQGVDEFIKGGEESQSDAVKADKSRFRERMDSAQGIGDEVAAVGGYIADAPLMALSQAAGSIAVPAGVIGAAGKAAGAVGAGARGVQATGLAAGAGLGAAGAGGDAAGTAYELAIKAGATEDQAQDAARQASLIPAAVGGLGGMVGAERLLAGAKGFGGNVASRALKTGAVEGGQEAIEEGVTQYEGQRAVVPLDPSIDPMKGVAGAATMGAALGAAAGGGVSLLTGGSQTDALRQEAADLAMADIGTAATVDDAVAAFTAATDVPVMPEVSRRSQNAEALNVIRALDPAQQQEALQLLALLDNPRTPEGPRRLAQQRMAVLQREATTIPAGEAAEMLPTADARELTDAERAAYAAGDKTPDEQLREQRLRGNADRYRERMGLPPAVEATELVPTGDATEVENIPTPDVFEDIPTAEASEVLPVGDAAEVLPTPDVTEEADPVPAGEATEIEPEQADTGLLLTADNQPYGTRSGAYVRAKREGLPPESIVTVPGGWAVKKESQGEQPDVASTAAGPAGASDGRAPDAVGSSVAVGRVAADTGGRVPTTAPAAVAGGAEADPAAAGAKPDPALTVKALSKQWAEAVARGDMTEARRLNDAIVEAKKPPQPREAAAPPPPAAPAADTREQAIRRVWGSAPRKLGEWAPITVQVGDRKNDMLATQRTTRSDGKGDSAITMRVMRMGKRIASEPLQPLLFTFKLTGENKVEQVGTAKVPTPEDIAQWEAAGFTMPGAAPKAKAPAGEPVNAAAPPVATEVQPSGPGSESTGTVAAAPDDAPAMPTASWVIREKGTGKVVMETFDRKKVDALNTEKYEAVPIQEHLAGINREIKAEAAAPAPATPQVSTWTDTPAEPTPPTKPPEPPQQTRPERLIELRKRQSVLKQLLECLG